MAKETRAGRTAVALAATGLGACAVALLVWLGAPEARSVGPRADERPAALSGRPAAAAATERPAGASPTASERAALGSAATTAPTATGATQRATVAGALVDADGGAPLAGSVVAWPAAARRAGEPHRAAADGSGRFVLELDGAGPWDARAQAPGYAARDLWIERDAGELVVELERAPASLSGVVASARGPVAGARVSLRGAGADRDAVTGPDGAWSLAGLAEPGAAAEWLTARADGFAVAARALTAEERAAGRAELFLEPERTLRVTCLRADLRAPLAGARVALAAAGLDALDLAPAAEAGPDGAALVLGVPPGACLLRVESEGLLPALLEIGPGRPGSADEVLALLQPGGEVVGRIADARGEPLAARVTFWPVTLPDERWSGVPGARLERVQPVPATGALACRDLVPDVVYRGVAEAPGCAPRSLGRDVRVRPGARVDLGELRLDAGREVAGRVVDAEGRPVAGARLAVRGSLGHWIEAYAWRVPPSAADGTFRVAGAPSEAFWIDAFAPEGSARRRVAPLEAEVELELAPPETWTLAARLRDGAGAPAPDVTVRVVQLDPETGERRARAVASDARGRLEAPGLTADEAVLESWPGARFRLALGEETFAREDGERDVAVTRARFVAGRVVALPAAEALRGARAAWSERAWGEAPAAAADAEGAFRLAAPEDAGVVLVSAAGHVEREVAVPAGAADVDLGEVALAPARLLVVRVRDAAGEPVPAVEVSAAAAGARGWPASGLTDARGEVALALAAEGLHRVVAGARGSTLERDVACSGAGPWVVELAGLSAARALAVRVRVLDPDGVPLSAGRTVALAGRELLFGGEPDDQGWVEFAGVPPGEYSLRTELAGGGLAGSPLVVPADLASFEAEVRLAR